MPELRQALVSGQWVVIATERAKRPHDFVRPAREGARTNNHCPFCEGNEVMTPPEVMAYRLDGSRPNRPGWQLRVVPNLYPAFVPSKNGLGSRKVGLYNTMEAVGVHEVLINSPDHYSDVGRLAVDDVDRLIRAYVDRYLAHKDRHHIEYIHVIVNHGREAGASLEHPHAQLFGLPLVSGVIERELQRASKYYQDTGTCVFCHMIEEELKIGDRLVLDNGRFVVVTPFASAFPFEMWVLPKAHRSNFEEMDGDERRAFAVALRETLARLEIGLNDPPFNYYVHTSPCKQETREYYHWHLEILPKLAVAAGLELGAGVFINTAQPEAAAAFLRQVELKV